MDPKHADTARMLVSRLERLSADSLYAHRASGLRGSILRFLEHVEQFGPTVLPESITAFNIEELLSLGFEILERAAKEIRPPRRWDQEGPDP